MSLHAHAHTYAYVDRHSCTMFCMVTGDSGMYPYMFDLGLAPVPHRSCSDLLEWAPSTGVHRKGNAGDHSAWFP